MQTRQTRAAILLAAGYSKQEGARSTGVAPSTLRRWLKQPEFHAILRLETQRSETALRDQMNRSEAIDIKRAVVGAQIMRAKKEDKRGQKRTSSAHHRSFSTQC